MYILTKVQNKTLKVEIFDTTDETVESLSLLILAPLIVDNKITIFGIHSLENEEKADVEYKDLGVGIHRSEAKESMLYYRRRLQKSENNGG